MARECLTKVLRRLILEDNVEEVTNILNLNENLRENFNSLHYPDNYYSSEIEKTPFLQIPLLHLAVNSNSQKVVEYLLSQDFVDKSIINSTGENIYHKCVIRGDIKLFSLIERKVAHNLLLNNSLRDEENPFHLACQINDIFFVNKVYKILESLQVDLTSIKKRAMEYAIRNNDREVIKYVSSIDGVQINDDAILVAIRSFEFDFVVHLLNVYLRQSIPSHLHNQIDIFQITNYNNNHVNIDNNCNINNNCDNNNLNNNNDNNNNNNNCDSNNNCDNNNNLSEFIEENCKKLINIKGRNENRIWHDVCENKDIQLIKFIFSINGIKQEILKEEKYNIETSNDFGLNPFLIACDFNSIKVIKYIHKLFPSFINSERKFRFKRKNAAYFVITNSNLNSNEKVKILHYLYLNGIDFHFLSESKSPNEIIYYSIYNEHSILHNDILQYLKVISQDFDYQNNQHDNNGYKKPSFWKEINFNNNKLEEANKLNNNNYADEQLKRVNEWKNRFEEHVIRHLSKMIQEHMLNTKKILDKYFKNKKN